MAELKWKENEAEICLWMDREIDRLGVWFERFLITWCCSGNYAYGQLYMWSEAKYDCNNMNHPYGQGIMVAECYDENGLWRELIREEGGKLYCKLKKKYLVSRSLGRK